MSPASSMTLPASSPASSVVQTPQELEQQQIMDSLALSVTEHALQGEIVVGDAGVLLTTPKT